jgi:hypothetical protein
MACRHWLCRVASVADEPLRARLAQLARPELSVIKALADEEPGVVAINCLRIDHDLWVFGHRNCVANTSDAQLLANVDIQGVVRLVE